MDLVMALEMDLLYLVMALKKDRSRNGSWNGFRNGFRNWSQAIEKMVHEKDQEIDCNIIYWRSWNGSRIRPPNGYLERDLEIYLERGLEMEHEWDLVADLGVDLENVSKRRTFK